MDGLKALFNARLLAGAGITVLAYAGSFALYTYISPILLQVTKVSESTASLLMLDYGVMAAIGNLWGGRLTDHKGTDLAVMTMLDGLAGGPTGNALDGAMLAELFKGKQTPLKAALLDQTLMAGLGNIYVSEALWRAGLSPRRAAGTIAPAKGRSSLRADRLAAAVRSVIADAIEAGGSSLRDYRQADGSEGNFQHRFSVYDREGEPCPKPTCRGVITRIVQSGRSTFYCPVCQR